MNLSPLSCPHPAIPGSPGYQGLKGSDGPPGSKGQLGPNGWPGKGLWSAINTILKKETLHLTKTMNTNF